MQWPVRDASSEIPAPRLLTDIPVSVCGSEFAPITIGPLEEKLYEVTAGQKLTVPLLHTRRSEFSGSTITLKTFGCGFTSNPSFDVSLTAEKSEAVLDLAKLKPKPGDYEIAFYGSAVAKYRYNLEAVTAAEEELKTAKAEVEKAKKEAARLTEVAKAAGRRGETTGGQSGGHGGRTTEAGGSGCHGRGSEAQSGHCDGDSEKTLSTSWSHDRFEFASARRKRSDRTN